ncbi:zinc-binding alcohol dehydrogenase family protein (macronuclear) [Tetrahymena thermophila SB210]|uniref:Zinc-binding alcohol dehydrogenase family protein n=1 Tax=Tetrahymena thermophila (strain SB210) TaxID=312017 RepID=A4VDT7_TETTS|nr:zinc-binding alcohol dehydrogenase family protein [Tetrahymena thermophila SB210]EDK31688.1 zinc-binding alcohol dehydrogenase family protein [Tetrahymena thermophila SB210]|eukprot:XP_001470816.1 zinc-binding alcohol dehydrogenase family protein [Tetrahymena thermophila SB210]
MSQILPQTIKAIGLTDPKGDLQLIQIPIKTLGPQDILIRVEAISINPLDYKWAQHMRTQNISESSPAIFGYDASGVVVQTGSDCRLFKVGDQVIYSGDFTKLGSNSNYQIVDERLAGKKPQKLTHPEAAAIPLVALTAYEALVEELGILEINKIQNQSKKILIVGGAGGVGSIAIQIAKKILGLTVITTASRVETINFCKKMGADYVINHQNALAEELKKINIESLDYIFNTVDMTQQYFNQFTPLIKPFGHIVGIVGFEQPLNIQGLFLKRARLSVECIFTRAIFQVEPERQNQILNKIGDLYDSGIFISTVQIEKPFNLENLLEAHAFSESGKTIGKVVLSNVQDFFERAN